MRYSQSEKMEFIHLVEQSNLSIRNTLEELDVPRSTFYNWFRKYQEEGFYGLAYKKPGRKQFWNRIPESVREQVVDLTLEQPDKSSKQLAWHFTDTEGYLFLPL